MIKIENVEVMNFEGAIRGMRNPMNSWSKSDSFQCNSYGGYRCYSEKCPKYTGDNCAAAGDYIIGKDDLALMKKLVKSGSEHRKFMRQIFVCVDITAPLYWY